MARDVLFSDRVEAGRRLAARLTTIEFFRPIVYALPRGGVPVGAEVAAALAAPLDLVLVRKLGAPLQPELAIGAVVDGETPETVLNDDVVAMTGADAAYIAAVTAREIKELERRKALYLGGRRRPDPVSRDAIVVDDGIATGATVTAAVHALKRRQTGRVIVAVPLAPADTVEKLEREADMVVCLEQPRFFQSIGMWYGDFHQLTDAEVTALLDAAEARLGGDGR